MLHDAEAIWESPKFALGPKVSLYKMCTYVSMIQAGWGWGSTVYEDPVGGACLSLSLSLKRRNKL